MPVDAPLISVIVPVWNVEDHVGACLASLAAQGLGDFEAIVVDDGSTDDSLARARAAVAGDARFRFLSQPNRGLSAARNAGLAVARGDFVAFLDSDDRVAPEWLSALHGAVCETGADWAACAIRFVNAEGPDRVHPAIHGPPPAAGRRGAAADAAVRFPLADWRDVIRHYPSAWNKLYRRALIGDARFDEGTLYEDHAFFWRLAARTDHLLWMPRPLYLQTQGRAGQITRAGDARVFQQIAVLDRLSGIARASPRPGAGPALARLATRLSGERASVLADPALRARFASACGDWFDRHGLVPDAGWDDAIGRVWTARLAGEMPLSVVVTGRGGPALAATLDSLAAQSLRDMEVIVVPGDAAAAEMAGRAAVRVLPLQPGTTAAARARGLAAAEGAVVTFLAAGARLLHPDALSGRLEAMLRAGAAVAVAGACAPASPGDGTGGDGTDGDRNGDGDGADRRLACFHDSRPAPPGPLTIDPATARALRLVPEALMLRRRIVLDAAPDGAPLTPRRLRAALPAAGASGLILGHVDVRIARIGAGRSTSLPESSITRDAGHTPVRETEMLRFTTRGGGIFSCNIDFRDDAFANISFFDGSGEEILFHLSLRLKEWLAVTNRRQAGHWEGERALPILLEETGDRIEIRFPAPDRVEVLINGEELLVHEGTYERLDEIVAADFQGGVVLESLGMEGPHNTGRSGMGALHLVEPLRLEGWAFDPQGGPVQQTGLLVAGNGTSLPVVAHDRPDLTARFGAATARLGLATILPGRAWKGLPDLEADVPDPVLQLQATSNGIPCGLPLTLQRSEIIARIEAITAGQDTTALLTAIEHVRFGRMWPLLSPGAQDALRRTAETFKVTEFLFPPDAEADAPAASDATATGRPVAVAASAVSRAVSRAAPAASQQPDRLERALRNLPGGFARRLRAEPDADATVLMQQMLRQPLVPALRHRLCLELTDTFCARDAFPALFAEARADPRMKFSAEGADNAWIASLVAPYLYMQQEIGALRGVLWSLSRPLPGWLCTPALSWVVRDVLTLRSAPLPEEAREDIVYAFMAVIDQERRDYAGRTSCVELIRTMVTLLGTRQGLAEHLRRDAVACALRAYGLSRAFWEAFDAAGTAPSPRLQAAREAFAAVEAMAAGGAAARRDPVRRQAAEAALRLMAAVGCGDVSRVRLELFGPAGLPAPERAASAEAGPRADGDLPPVAALLAAGLDPEEAALRHFAAPGAGPVPEDLWPLTRRAVAVRHTTDAPPDPMAAVLERASRAAAALLLNPGDGLRDDAHTAERIAPLMADIASLSAARSAFVGIGLGLRLLHALLRQGATGTAAAVLRGFDGICRGLPDTQAAAAAPAVVNGLWALRRFEAGIDAAPERSDAAASRIAADLAGMALTMLPDAMPEVEALPLPVEDATVGLSTDPRAPLFDTLVVVLSCRPYLKTRLPVLESGWLARLQALGVPWVVAVGGAEEGTRGGAGLKGRVLHLDAPDDYEGLPLKTLAMARWVHDHTGFAHVFKIDDDCLLDAEAVFHGQSHTAFDYYGRRINRRPGDMDRQWHIAKSTSDHGRLQIDKSPEPSVYCDGGAGYTLGRRALARLEAARATPAGQTLISVSLMEDKLVGDLLAQQGIGPQGIDYRMSILRRPVSGATPVPRWADSFLPGPASGVRLVHLDSTEGQAGALEALDTAELRPAKIWPTLQPPRLGYNANALTLMSDHARLTRAAAAPVAVVACLRNEAEMLPVFLAHYRALGIEGFLVVDNASDDGTLDLLLAEPDVAVFSTDTDYSRSLYGVAWQQALLAHYRADRWTVVADADELLVCDIDRRSRLPDLLDGPEFADAEAVRLFMLDMYPEGPLSDADLASGDPFAKAGHVDREPFLTEWLGLGPHSDSPTWTSALRHRLFPGSRPELFVAQKLALLRYRPWMRLSAGLHYVADARLAERAFILAHFKYTAAFHAKARAEVARGQHFNAAEEYRRYLTLLEDGRDGLFDPQISVPWQDCATVRDLLGAPPARKATRRKAR